MEVIKIDPRDCVRWKFANRSSFEFGDINLLAEDIKRNGQIEPVFVRELDSNNKFKYEIIAGSRRFQACLNANLMLNAVICNVSDIDASIIQIKENVNLALSDYSKGISYAKLQKELGISQKKLAEITECSRRKIENFLCFAKIDQSIWDAVANMSKVSAKSAETIYLISKKSQQHKDALIEVAEEIRKGAGSKRIELLVNKIILGEKNNNDDELIQSTDGTIYATWKNDKIILSKNINFDKKKFSAHLLNFFAPDGL
jgi:ParB family transcriptional regulator, chromosome partitioning protein